MHRRTFGIAATAAALSIVTPAFARTRIVDVEGVWLGHGPLMTDRLIPGLRIDVELKRGRACILFENRFLGFLPTCVAGSGTVVEIASAKIRQDGRLRIQVTISE